VWAALVLGAASWQPLQVQAHECAGVDAALAALATAHAQLVAVPEGEYPDPFLTPPAQHGIDASRAAIAHLVGARMACAGNETAGALQDELRRLVQPLGTDCGESCAASAYKSPPTFDVVQPDARPELLAIVAQLPIECGSDASLFVYARERDAWRERVRWQSEPYDKVSGALEAFDYRIAPSDAQGNWYVLVKDFMPWCSSTWTTIRYAALRPASEQAPQKVLLRGDASMWWGSDDVGRIRADAAAFEVRFHSYSIDLGVHNREWIRRYAIHGDTVRRVQPVANTARDFADEWVVSAWTQASAWTEPKQRTELQKWHERLRGKDMPDYSFVAIHACKDRADHVEVEMTDQRDESDYFLSVVGGAENFRLTRVAERADPHCAGKDLLESMQTR